VSNRDCYCSVPFPLGASASSSWPANATSRALLPIEKHSHSCRVLRVLRESVSAPGRRVCHPRLSLLAATSRGNLRTVWNSAASMVLLRPQATRIQATSALAASCDRYCVWRRRPFFRRRLYELSSTNDTLRGDHCRVEILSEKTQSLKLFRHAPGTVVKLLAPIESRCAAAHAPTSHSGAPPARLGRDRREAGEAEPAGFVYSCGRAGCRLATTLSVFAVMTWMPADHRVYPSNSTRTTCAPAVNSD